MNDSLEHSKRLLAKLSQKRVPKRGDIYLRELIQNRNIRIHCSNLKYLYNQKGVGTTEFETLPDETKPESGFSVGYFQLAIEMTDSRTIRQCRARIIALIEQEAYTAECNDSARLEDIRSEKDACIAYLKECLTAKGKISLLYDQQTDDYRTVQKALKRTRDAVAITEPDLAQYIDEHLETGYWCIWREVI